jgi:hypothetical protein
VAGPVNPVLRDAMPIRDEDLPPVRIVVHPVASLKPGFSQMATVRAATTENSVGETSRSESVSSTISDGKTGQRSTSSSLTGR